MQAKRPVTVHRIPIVIVILLGAITSMFASLPAFADDQAQPIALHPDNPHYFLWRGKPTITDCVITANGAEEWGSIAGGVYCHNSDPMISNCIIAGNVAYSVGGVMCSHASPTLINNVVTANSSAGVSCQSQRRRADQLHVHAEWGVRHPLQLQ